MIFILTLNVILFEEFFLHVIGRIRNKSSGGNDQ